jgi:hypothetical protein
MIMKRSPCPSVDGKAVKLKRGEIKMEKRSFVVSLLSITVAAALFAQSDPLNYVQTGTATHELNSENLVAAHAILPIGQEVLVTNLENEAHVTVTISERISPASSRIIDLSSAAAMDLAIFDETAEVTIEATLRRDDPASEAAPATPETAESPAPETTEPAAPESSAPAVAAPVAPETVEPVAPVPVAPPAVAAIPVVPAKTSPAPKPVVAAKPPIVVTPPPSTGYTVTSEVTPVVPSWSASPAAPASSAPATSSSSGYTPVSGYMSTPMDMTPIIPGYTPTSEITAVAPPWETGYVPWPAPQPGTFLDPWISGIPREQRNLRALDRAQVPTPIYTPPPAFVSPPAPVSPPAFVSPPAPVSPPVSVFPPAPVSPPVFVSPPVSVSPSVSASPSAPPQMPDRDGPSVKVLPAMPGRGNRTFYRVQVGAFSVGSNAQEAFDRLLNAGFNPVFERQGGLIKVQIPRVQGDEMQVIGRRLYSIGFREVLIRSER